MKNYKVYLSLVLLLFLVLSACEKRKETSVDVGNSAVKFVKFVWVDKDKDRAAKCVSEEAELALDSMVLFSQNSSVNIADIKLLDCQKSGNNWAITVEIANVNLQNKEDYQALIKMSMDEQLKINSLSCSVCKNKQTVVEM